MDSIVALAETIKKANKITVLSGAGCSTESGIPDFRSSTGLWTLESYGLSRQQLMHVSYFNRHPDKFWVAYKDIFDLKLTNTFEPNRGHSFLSFLESDLGKEVNIFTQNVDGLHQKAGSKNVFEVHGSMRVASCISCGTQYDLDYVNLHEVPHCNSSNHKKNVCNRYIPIKDHPANYIDCEDCNTRHWLHEESGDSIRCKGFKERTIECRSVLSPDVVLFGESIRYYNEAKKSLLQSDLFLVLGTSLEVGPINEIPLFIPKGRCKSAIINLATTELDSYFDMVFRSSIGDTLEAVKELLNNKG